ncbi:GtrA family protein [Inhella proteolytica]|uniref:GtrA family protein n=1 Tax=Inhella proteolytica TaxID=2795029 RepID=A0A931J9H2_9BURK|nr:GtrA family protein [Inhella proteolytica]MBH9578842.1 GtrA family protein [Inhella proteolytica]
MRTTERAAARGEFLRFLLAGLANTALGYAVFLVLHQGLGLQAGWANAWSYGAGLLQALLLNRWFVFQQARLSAPAVLRFALGFGLCFGLNQAVLHALLGLGRPAALAQLAAMASYTLSFFVLNRAWVWKRA